MRRFFAEHCVQILIGEFAAATPGFFAPDLGKGMNIGPTQLDTNAITESH